MRDGHHHGFEERVRGQPAGTVKPGHGHLADGEEPGQAGLPVESGAHTAALVCAAGTTGIGF
jgi:hypothetical protein